MRFAIESRAIAFEEKRIISLYIFLKLSPPLLFSLFFFPGRAEDENLRK